MGEKGEKVGGRNNNDKELVLSMNAKTMMFVLSAVAIGGFSTVAFVDAANYEQILRSDFTGVSGSTTLDDSVDVFARSVFDFGDSKAEVSIVNGHNTLVSNEKLSRFLTQTQDSRDHNTAPHMSGMSFIDYEKSHFYVQDATVKRIMDRGTEIEIIGVAHSENPVVYCHGMPLVTLGVKEGQAIVPGLEFSEIVSLPLYHQRHSPELIETKESINPFFEEKTFLVLK